jgi:HEAT repeat protein
MEGLLTLFGGQGLRDFALWLIVALVAAVFVSSLVFAAYALLLRYGHDRRQRRWKLLTERWEPVMLQALAESDAQAVQDLRALVDPPHRLHFVRFVLEYARRVKRAESEVLKDLASPYLEPLRERTRSRHAEVRSRAVQTLGTLGLPRYADEVLAALDDPSPVVAMVAARSLCDHGDVSHAEAVIGALHRFEVWNRTFLASMLASIGAPGLEILRETLADGARSPWVRAVAADALASLKDIEAGEIASRVVELEEDRELVVAALRLLTLVGDPEDAAVVRPRTVSPDFVVRCYAHTALGSLGSREDEHMFLDGIEDESPWVALHAARALRSAGGESRLRTLGASDHPGAELARQVLREGDA